MVENKELVIDLIMILALALNWMAVLQSKMLNLSEIGIILFLLICL